MKKVLFVCYGNIMRSQIAEAYYNHFTNSSAGTSAGTDEFSTSYYTKPHPDVIAILQEEGIDISHKKVKQVTPEMVDAADEVYVLNDREDCPRFLTESPKVIFWNIPDPYGLPEDSLRRIKDAIRDKVQAIIR